MILFRFSFFPLQNVKGSEKYNDHYEIHHNKVYLYFAKVMEEFLEIQEFQILSFCIFFSFFFTAEFEQKWH